MTSIDCTAGRWRRRSSWLSSSVGTGLAVLAVLGLCPVRSWASTYGSIRGTVHDALGAPVAGARVELQYLPSGRRRTVQTDARGQFVFPSVSIGRYVVEVRRKGFTQSEQSVAMVPGYFPDLDFSLPRSGGHLGRVTISASAQQPVLASVTPISLVSSEDIRLTPGAALTNSLAMITDYVPGAYIVHDQLHVRGGHQTAWLVNGVEIPNTNIASNLGPQIDPQDIEVLGAERGDYQADQGDRTYGIFNVIPKSGFARNDEGVLDLTAGNFGQTDDYLSMGSHSGKFAYYASVDGNRSNLGIGTPVSQVIHDQEHGYGAFTNLDYAAGENDQLRFVASSRQDDYQIPDCTEQESLNPDLSCTPPQVNDVQHEGDTFAILSWEHTFNPDAVLTSSLLYHFNRADYDGGANDAPGTVDRRSSSYEGGEEQLKLSFDRNHFETGLYGFAQQDQDYYLLFNNGSAGGNVADANQPTGGLLALYAQDTYDIDRWVHISAGVRHTHFHGSISEDATNPRTGLTVQVPRLNWVFSAFWGKYYQAPPLDTLSGPLVQFAASNTAAFLPLHGERDEVREFGVSIPLQGWTIHADYFVNQARNFFDHNPIGNSAIFFPLTDTGALIRAHELTVRSPLLWQRARFHLAYSNQTADAFGGITGGLTNFAPPGGYYALDHDQRNTLNMGLDTSLPGRYYASAEVYVGSGFSNGNAPPSHLPSHAELNLSVGRDITRNLSVSLTGLNVFDRHLMIDNSLTFGGEHWNDPFEIYAALHYKFHY
jgi:Carboxypeptidase regulatory-like domain/TonB dependent receptor-like, beta-barrel